MSSLTDLIKLRSSRKLFTVVNLLYATCPSPNGGLTDIAEHLAAAVKSQMFKELVDTKNGDKRRVNIGVRLLTLSETRLQANASVAPCLVDM